MSYTFIIIDDEWHAIEYLTDCIATMPRLALIKAYTDPELALRELLQMPTQVDFLFTDVEMGHLNGLDLAAQIKHHIKFVVLTVNKVSRNKS